MQSDQENAAGHGQLGVWDTISIIIGIVIGTVVFKSPTFIFKNTADPWEGLGVWVIGGALALIGAFCYAELATTYPRSGGDYVYLTRAFGRPVGFLFGWAQLVVVLSGSTGAMAFVFGDYLATFLGYEGNTTERTMLVTGAAFGAVGLFTVLNFFGVVLGKRVQDALVVVKLAGMALIIIGGLMYTSPGAFTMPDPPPGRMIGFGTALILVMYAYGGWNDAAFVAADLRNPRSITKALIGGIVIITGVYCLVNLAYILGAGWTRATDFATGPLPVAVLRPMSDNASKIMGLIVMVSALGAINGLIFTGSRVYASLGSEHRLFSLLGRWNPTFRAPINAIVTQAVITLAMILQVGTEAGRTFTNDALRGVGIPPIPWDRFQNDGFDALFAGTAPTFWIFFLLTGLSLFVLRAKDSVEALQSSDPNLGQPFRLTIPWFPLLPLIFCGSCAFGIYSALDYAGWICLIGFVPLALGVPLYLISALQERRQVEP